MKVLALITARAGSKRLPGKNMLMLGDKPLINWSIDIVKGMPYICDILVSTDDLEISMASSKAGALVPWLRPPELANDTASSVDTVLHGVNWYEETFGLVDGVLLLQPTSPFRKRETILKGIDQFIANAPSSVVGVSLASTHPFWCIGVEKDGYAIPYISGDGLGMRSQDLPKAYAINGAFYLVQPEILRSTKTLYGKKWIPLIFEGDKEGLDIDTALDWHIAQYFLNK